MHVICRISFSLLFAMFCLLETSAQKSFQPKQVEFEWKGIIYRNESTLKGTLHTNGYSIAYNKGKIKSYYKTNYYHIELGHISDPREQKQNKNIPYQFSKISRSFKFGKQNSLYMIRTGKGTKTLLTDKTKRKGVAIGYNYEAGPAIAILKPYYLELVYGVERDGKFLNELKEEKLNDSNADKFLDYNFIFGGGSPGSGWKNISVVPGIQGKLGLFFSLGAFEQYATSIEVGIMGDIYTRKIPIMVETDAISAKPYFINFYATIEFGKRTN